MRNVKRNGICNIPVGTLHALNENGKDKENVT